ncbi:recombination protein O N-terminal domain-containing protein [bacterium]|nr:recombination protein O N-terminal domain-containing protein [bacterium]
MKTIKEPIFLISATPYRDSDLIVNLLSAQNGKLSSTVYSGRKLGRSSSFLYQPGDLLEVEYQVRESHEFIRILNISGKSILNAGNFSYQRFLFHSYLLELISKIAQPGNPSEDLFDILSKNNQFCWDIAGSLFFMARLIWQLIQHGGFGIDYQTCRGCHRQTWRFNEQHEAVFRKEKYLFHPHSGSLICNQCKPAEASEKIITPAMLKVMWLMDDNESTYSKKPDIPEHVMGNVFDCLNDNESTYSKKPDIPERVMGDVIDCLNQFLLQRYEIHPKSLSAFMSSFKSVPEPKSRRI